MKYEYRIVYCSGSVNNVALMNHRVKSIPKMEFGSSHIREVVTLVRPTLLYHNTVILSCIQIRLANQN
jgi:hypothetical protein